VKLAHLSDLHLGFSAYPRHERGRNVREADVATAFLRAVEELERVRPDVVLVAGDVFDRPDPPSVALVTFARGIETLRAALPSAPILIAAGPRDTPCRGDDPGVLGALDTVPGVEAATAEPRTVRVRDELAVHLFPHRAALGEPRALPVADPTVRWNVLVAHARAPRADSVGGRPATTVDPKRWDYVALGGEHVQRAPHPHVRWAGSLERIGWRPWEEALEEKGFVTYDLAERRAEFHAVPVRGVVSLAPIRVAAGDPDRVRRRVREVTDEVPGGVEGKIVLVRVQGAGPSDLTGVTEDVLPALRNRALHLSAVLDDSPAARAQRPPAPQLDPRLAALLEEEGVPRAAARARAADLFGEPRAEATAR
jgi:DNA repair exonuclease SbcCD nuclease subunit